MSSIAITMTRDDLCDQDADEDKLCKLIEETFINTMKGDDKKVPRVS